MCIARRISRAAGGAVAMFVAAALLALVIGIVLHSGNGLSPDDPVVETPQAAPRPASDERLALNEDESDSGDANLSDAEHLSASNEQSRRRSAADARLRQALGLVVRHDLPNQLVAIQNPEGYVLHNLRVSPDGRWEAAFATADIPPYGEDVLILVDRATGEVVLEIGPSTHGVNPTEIFQWTDDGETLVLAGTPAVPGNPPTPPPGTDPSMAPRAVVSDLIESGERDHEYVQEYREWEKEQREASQRTVLVALDTGSLTDQELLHVEGSPGPLAADGNGGVQVATALPPIEPTPRDHPVFTTGARYVVHHLDGEGETTRTQEIPLLPNEGPGAYTEIEQSSALRLDAPGETVWATVLTRYARDSAESPRSEQRPVDVDIARLPYDGSEPSDWEYVIQDARLIDMDPSGTAVLYRCMERREHFIFDVNTGEHTPVLPHVEEAPRPIGLAEYGTVVQFEGHHEGWMTRGELWQEGIASGLGLFEYVFPEIPQ